MLDLVPMLPLGLQDDPCVEDQSSGGRGIEVLAGEWERAALWEEVV